MKDNPDFRVITEEQLIEEIMISVENMQWTSATILWFDEDEEKKLRKRLAGRQGKSGELFLWDARRLGASMYDNWKCITEVIDGFPVRDCRKIILVSDAGVFGRTHQPAEVDMRHSYGYLNYLSEQDAHAYSQRLLEYICKELAYRENIELQLIRTESDVSLASRGGKSRNGGK